MAMNEWHERNLAFLQRATTAAIKREFEDEAFFTGMQWRPSYGDARAWSDWAKVAGESV